MLWLWYYYFFSFFLMHVMCFYSRLRFRYIFYLLFLLCCFSFLPSAFVSNKKQYWPRKRFHWRKISPHTKRNIFWFTKEKRRKSFFKCISFTLNLLSACWNEPSRLSDVCTSNLTGIASRRKFRRSKTFLQVFFWKNST